jgi:hypothetical protein
MGRRKNLEKLWKGDGKRSKVKEEEAHSGWNMPRTAILGFIEKKKKTGRYWASVLEKKTAKLIGRVIKKKSVALSITVSKKFHVEECVLKGCMGGKRERAPRPGFARSLSRRGLLQRPGLTGKGTWERTAQLGC